MPKATVVPASQVLQAACFNSAYWPTAQFWQPSASPAAANLPVAQIVVQLSTLVASLPMPKATVVPASQVLHVVCVVSAYWPTAQSVHASFVAATAEYLPGAQFVQVFMATFFVVPYVPAAQAAPFLHALWPRSSAYVPTAQSVQVADLIAGADVPKAHHVHFWHRAAPLDRYSPAAHEFSVHDP